MTTAQAIKLLLSVLIGVFAASLQPVLFALPFVALLVIAVIILVLRMIGNPDAIYIGAGIVIGALAALLVSGLSVSADPFLLYVAALWLILKV